MEETRALLDALMGPNRNKKEASSDRGALPDFADSGVCKNFLCGFCPHDWFNTTPKRRLAFCNLIHSDLMKEKFEKHPDVDKYRAWYEEDFLNYLQPIARDCDAYIVRERAKCRPKSSGGKARLPADVKSRCEDMERRYAELVKKSEDHADESVSQSKEYMSQALTIKEELDNVKSKYISEFQGEDICEVCGVKYPLGGGGAEWHDKESHKKGKTHTGYAKIRDKIDELLSKRKEWEKHRSSRKREYEAQLKKEKAEIEREKEKERQKERERQREREKQKEKEREELRERERQLAELEAKEKARKDKEKEKQKEKDEKSKDSKSKRGRDSSDRSRSRPPKKRGRSNSGEHEVAEQPPPPPLEPADGSSDESSQDGIIVAEEDIPEFWERVQKLKGAVRNEAVAALDAKSKERLETFLIARAATKTKKKKGA